MTFTTDERTGAAAGAGPRAGAWVFSPEGSVLAIIPTPESPANVEFGGEGRKTLYIMAGKSLYRIRTTLTGFHMWPPRR
jgi:gluconolactonase